MSQNKHGRIKKEVVNVLDRNTPIYSIFVFYTYMYSSYVIQLLQKCLRALWVTIGSHALFLNLIFI